MSGPFKFHPPSPSSRTPVVYAIGWTRQGPIKIGYTARDPEQRLIQILGAHPDPRDLRVLASWPGGRGLELALHRHFADRRMRRGAEWFKVSVTELADAIEAMAHADPEPETE